MRNLQKVARGGALAAVATAALLTPQFAYASTGTASGYAEYNTLKYVGTTFVKSGRGNVDLDYDNGIGSGGNDLLWLRLCKNSGSSPGCFADSRAITEHNTYNLGRDVLGGTRFVIQYRRDANSTFNPYWEGTVKY